MNVRETWPAAGAAYDAGSERPRDLPVYPPHSVPGRALAREFPRWYPGRAAVELDAERGTWPPDVPRPER